MGPAGGVDECIGGEGCVVGEVDAGLRKGGYVGDVDVDEVFVEEGKYVRGVVEDANGSAYPDGAAAGDQLFGFWVVVIFRFFDRAVVYHPEEATQKRSSYPGVVK